MKALVTGASSGIGRDIARYLGALKIDLILVGRNRENLEKLQNELKVDVKIIIADLSLENKVKELYLLTKNDDIDILVNNAGFGSFGEFSEVDINNELNMIDTNIKAVHMLTKLFLRDMKKKNSGYILNVSSISGFMPGGALMSTYYATKSYIRSLTNAVWEELRAEKSKIRVSCLCPGPVSTNFNNVARVRFSLPSLSSEYVSKYAIDKMFKGKRVIIPGFKMKLIVFFSKIVPEKLVLKIAHNIQSQKK